MEPHGPLLVRDPLRYIRNRDDLARESRYRVPAGGSDRTTVLPSAVA
jgi:hypothetical protein